jgi:hypothetical protein
MSDAALVLDSDASGPSIPESGRDRSTIEFPYLDLDAAVDVARAIYARAGLGVCEIDELAAQMDQTVSGAFRLKTGTARTFGLVEKDSRSSFKLSPLGQRIVQATSEAEARATAFLAVPLYKAVFDRYRGHLLPPPRALEREMNAFGVAPRQTDKARQAFERSARQAGFFAQGEDRLVQPRFGRDVGSAEIPATAEVQVSASSLTGPGPSLEKPLEYQLIDLLKNDDISDSERSAVWTLVQFLAAKRSA